MKMQARIRMKEQSRQPAKEMKQMYAVLGSCSPNSVKILPFVAAMKRRESELLK